ncbi:hypothetical protein FSP39_017807 [Pinctada imbricata]|uniref:Uncharacterized protein n=1 Tax=Pinctada imbricata TaxID=66713 RepID=A0AA88XZV5_PINIB|nr:hypothetical protein FSP39_017807 [Pinctada imbricata]
MADLFQLIADGCTTRQFYLVLQSTGCDVNARNDRDETPLMSCIANVEDDGKRTTMIRLLLQRIADVNAYNKRGQTAIMYACILDQAETVVIILGKEKVDVNHRDFDGNTALMYACSLGNVMAVKTLFKYHTMGEIVLDFSARNREEATALEYALSGHHSQIVSLFTAVRTPNYTEPLNIEKFKSDKNGDKRKELSVDPVLFKSKSSPSDKNVAEEKAKPQNGISDRKRNENALVNGVPKITVSRATSDEDYMSDDMGVEEFGSLVQAMRECAVEMKQLRSNIENNEHTVNKQHRGKDKRTKKQKPKQGLSPKQL